MSLVANTGWQNKSCASKEKNVEFLKGIVYMKYCQHCGYEIENNSSFCEKCGNNLEAATANRKPTKSETRCKSCGNIFSKKLKACPKCKKRVRRFSPLKLILALIVVFAISIITFIPDGEGDDSSQPSITNEQSSENSGVIYFNDYFTIEYINLFEAPGVTASYLQLKIENMSNQKLLLSLDDVYVNDVAVESGSGMPIELESGKISQTPFILFTGNTGLTVDEMTKIEFKLIGYDDNYNEYATEKITITK